MKNIRIPFNLSEYEKGGYEVETRDGRSARIVCTDCMGSYPIIALVRENITCEDEHSYQSNGAFIENYNSSYDLFLKKQELEDDKRWYDEQKCIEDIKHEYNFQPYDKVLVRGYQGDKWRNDFFGYYNEQSIYKYVCTSKRFEQCIPYNEETKDLLGTTNDCPDKYKTWES
jgi:hypothetical protein